MLLLLSKSLIRSSTFPQDIAIRPDVISDTLSVWSGHLSEWLGSNVSRRYCPLDREGLATTPDVCDNLSPSQADHDLQSHCQEKNGTC